MLFALDWIRNVQNGIEQSIESLIKGLDLKTISTLTTENSAGFITLLLIAFVMCFAGFRFHKHVNAFIGGLFFGSLGLLIGHVVNQAQLSVAAVYAIMLFLVGYFVFYLGYFVNVAVISWLIGIAILAPLDHVLQGHRGWVMILPAIVFSIFYAKFQLSMSALFGAGIFGLMMYQYSSLLAMGIFIIFTISGIQVQKKLHFIYEKKQLEIMEEQRKKYPYGPGLAYGFEDPTVLNALDRTLKDK